MSPPPATTRGRTSITGAEKRQGRRNEDPWAVESSSSANEAHSSGSYAAVTGRTTGLSGSQHLAKTAHSECRIAGDAGSSEVHGSLQQPAGERGRVDECTPIQRGLPSKKETRTTADGQVVAATTRVSTSSPANKVGGRAGNDHCPPDECVDTTVSISGSNDWQLTCVCAMIRRGQVYFDVVGFPRLYKEASLLTPLTPRDTISHDRGNPLFESQFKSTDLVGSKSFQSIMLFYVVVMCVIVSFALPCRLQCRRRMDQRRSRPTETPKGNRL